MRTTGAPALNCYRAGVTFWFDQVDLIPGQRWKSAITAAIRSAKYFLALLSKHSMSKRGFVQKELQEALDVLDQIPHSGVFLIPARLDDCQPAHERLQELHRVDLFPSFEEGLATLRRVLTRPCLRPSSMW